MPEQTISRVLSSMSVALHGITIIHLRILLAQYLLRPTRKLGRATLKRFPIRSCSRWGLPSFSGHPKNWCALTAPFHPYLATRFMYRLVRRYFFCGTFLRVAATPCYGAPCPAELGLSSRILKMRAIVWSTPTLFGYSSLSLYIIVTIFPVNDPLTIGTKLKAILLLKFIVHLGGDIHMTSRTSCVDDARDGNPSSGFPETFVFG